MIYSLGFGIYDLGIRAQVLGSRVQRFRVGDLYFIYISFIFHLYFIYTLTQISFRFHSDFIRFHSDFIQISFRFHLYFIYTFI
jgi:hypothetical protein